MQDKTTIHMVPEPRKSELVKATYGIIGAMIEVYKNLGAGMPEYIYQEALLTELQANGVFFFFSFFFRKDSEK